MVTIREYRTTDKDDVMDVEMQMIDSSDDIIIVGAKNQL